MNNCIKKLAYLIGIAAIPNMSTVYAQSGVLSMEETTLTSTIYTLFNLILIIIPPIVITCVVSYIIRNTKLKMFNKCMVISIILIIFLAIYIYGCSVLLNYSNLFSTLY